MLAAAEASVFTGIRWAGGNWETKGLEEILQKFNSQHPNRINRDTDHIHWTNLVRLVGNINQIQTFYFCFLTMNSMRADQLRSKAEWIKKTVWCFSKDGNQVKKYGRRQASIREYQNMRETDFPWLFFLCWPSKASRCTGKFALSYSVLQEESWALNILK